MGKSEAGGTPSHALSHSVYCCACSFLATSVHFHALWLYHIVRAHWSAKGSNLLFVEARWCYSDKCYCYTLIIWGLIQTKHSDLTYRYHAWKCNISIATPVHYMSIYVKPHYIYSGCLIVKSCRLLQTYFGHLTCIAFVCMTRQVRGMLTIWKSLVEKLPAFIKLVSPFRKPNISISTPGEVLLFPICPWLHGYARNVANIGLLK